MDVWRVKDRELILVEGNLIHQDVEAIVNAANKSLILGGGVAGAIRAAGGPTIQEECNAIGPIEAGEAVLTSGGNLKAKYVIHAAGPVYGEGDEDKKLKNATLNSLKIAGRKKMSSIAFPAISTGIFHFPMRRCSEIMIKTAMEFLKKNEYPKAITLCLYGEKAYQIFRDSLKALTE